MLKDRKLVIVGDSAFAEVAYEYFTHDSPYSVVGFSVEAAYIKRTSLFGLSIVSFEELARYYDPAECDVYVAVVYTKLNRLRTRLCALAKAKGYKLASYVSTRAFVWRNATLGEHCFIFEGNVIQPYVRVGDNVVMWSGNHIGHHSEIMNNCFISSHVVIAGFAKIGESCFLGVNATVSNNVTVAEDCWIGPGVVITDNTQRGEFYRLPRAVPAKATTARFFKTE